MKQTLDHRQIEDLRTILKARARQLREEISQTLRKSDDEQYTMIADQVRDLEDDSFADLMVDVNLAEIDRDLQELRLIELQLQRYEASENNVHFRRRLYADSAEVHSFVVDEDCWFLACGRGAICVDSREEGFFRRSDLLGAPLPIASLTPVSPIAKALLNGP